MLGRNKNTTSTPTSAWGKIWRFVKFAGLGAVLVGGGRWAHSAGATTAVAGAVRNGVQKVKGSSPDLTDNVSNSSQDAKAAGSKPVGGDGGKVTGSKPDKKPDATGDTDGATTSGAPSTNRPTPGAL